MFPYHKPPPVKVLGRGRFYKGGGREGGGGGGVKKVKRDKFQTWGVFRHGEVLDMGRF